MYNIFILQNNNITKYVRDNVDSIKISFYETNYIKNRNDTPQDGVVLRTCEFKNPNNEIIQLFIFLYQIPITDDPLHIPNSFKIIKDNLDKKS